MVPPSVHDVHLPVRCTGAWRTGPGAGVKKVEDGDAITLMKLAFGGRLAFDVG
jgi:hypothetical protein